MTEKQNNWLFPLWDIKKADLEELPLGIEDFLLYMLEYPNPEWRDLTERFDGIDKALTDLEAQWQLISKVIEALKFEKQRLWKLESDQLKQKVDEEASDVVWVEWEYVALNSDIFPNLYAFNDSNSKRFCLVNKETQKILDWMWFNWFADDLLFPDILDWIDGKRYVLITNLITSDWKKSKITQLKELKKNKHLDEGVNEISNFSGDSFIVTSDWQKYLYVEQTRKYIQLSDDWDFQMRVWNANTQMGFVVLWWIDGNKDFEMLYSYKNFDRDWLEQRLPSFSAIMLIPWNKRCAICLDEVWAIAIWDIFTKEIVWWFHKLRGDWSREEPLRKLISQMDISKDEKEKFVQSLMKREILDKEDWTKAMKDFTI